MKLAVPIAAVIAVTLGVGVASAKSTFTKYKGTIKLTAQTFMAGPCHDADPHANLCPSGSDCFCETFGGNYSGTAGSGTVTGAGTIDETFGAAPAAGGEAGCSPLFEVIRVKGSKDSETFQFNGGSCLNLDGSVSHGGGAVLSSSTLFHDGAVLLLSGTFVTSPAVSGKISLTGLAK